MKSSTQPLAPPPRRAGTRPRRQSRSKDALVVAALAVTAAAWPSRGEAAERTELLSAYLFGAGSDERAQTAAFAMPPRSTAPSNVFQGTLTIPVSAPSFTPLVDLLGLVPFYPTTKEFPTFHFEFVQDGNLLIPTYRTGVVSSLHFFWDVMPGVGRVWDEPGDQGHSRASFPFTLMEVNENCTHNGLASFLFKSDGTISNVQIQTVSATCAYLEFDMFGRVKGSYTPYPVELRAEHVKAYAAEVATRLPVKPIEALATDFPGTDVSRFGLGVTPAKMTVFGLVARGVHYRGGCETRYGRHPYCDELVLPSYSLAKTFAAGVGLMRAERRFGPVMQAKVADLVPECAATGTWNDVTLNNLADMATGNFSSPDYQVDESSAAITSQFFLTLTHEKKVAFACDAWPRQSAPGTAFVYHTSDTYLEGVALQSLVSEQLGAGVDFFQELLVNDVYAPLGLSPVVRGIRRTLDERAQPFSGWGQVLLSDDVARLGEWLANSAHMDGRLDRRAINAALQRDPTDRGSRATVPGGTFYYNNNLWARQSSDLLPGCGPDAHIPYLSGYGGISVALLPNGIVYYYFSDGYELRRWSEAATEVYRSIDASCALPHDPDHDGVASDDICPGTPVGALVDPASGCSLAQLCPCSGPRGSSRPWRHASQYAACVASASFRFAAARLISPGEARQSVGAALRSSCGRGDRVAPH